MLLQDSPLEVLLQAKFPSWSQCQINCVKVLKLHFATRNITDVYMVSTHYPHLLSLTATVYL